MVNVEKGWMSISGTVYEDDNAAPEKVLLVVGRDRRVGP